MNRNQQQATAQRIRSQYTERPDLGLDRLRAPDKKVKSPPRFLPMCGEYPIYKAMLGRRKKKYAEQIMALSDEVWHDHAT